MKVRIKNQGEVTSFTHWWYMNRVGEEFEAEVCDKFPDEYYYTMLPIKDKLQKHHICKKDCEVISTN